MFSFIYTKIYTNENFPVTRYCEWWGWAVAGGVATATASGHTLYGTAQEITTHSYILWVVRLGGGWGCGYCGTHCMVLLRTSLHTR